MRHLFLLLATSFLFLPTNAFSDILVRYPSGLDAVSAAALSEAIGQAAGEKVVGISARPSPLPKAAQVPAGVTERLAAAASAYKRLELDAVINLLRDLEAACVQAVSFAVCRDALFDAAMLRAMSLVALGRPEEAQVEFRNAHIAHPSEVPDPKKYSPNILRAFAAACAETESLPRVEIHIDTAPLDTIVLVDGNSVLSRSLALVPGRHFIESRPAGFTDVVRIIELATTGENLGTVHLDSSPLADPEAWAALSSAVSDDQWSPGDPGIPSLMTRFQIDTVLLLAYLQGGNAMAVRAARLGKRDLADLPVLNVPWTPLADEFKHALQFARGLPMQNPPAQLPTLGPVPPALQDDAFAEDDESDLEDADEDEDPSIRFQTDAEMPVATEKKSIWKSPWFWISVGAVTAIVSGVVVAVQIQD